LERLRWSTAGRVRSLHWDGDELVDWVAGGTRWRLDGVQMDPPVQYAYGFDRAVVSPSGRYQALYTECGTKGLILDRWGSSDSVVLSYAMGGSQH
jgi:hypothetical protein